MTQRTHSTAERAPGVGDAIGHYRLIGLLGDGRLGRLYVAEQRGIRGVSPTVVLRRIRPEFAQDARFRALFKDAASSAPRFEHPNVVSIYEMGEAGGSCFFSMEYLPGENLASILTQCNTRAPMPPDIAAAVVKQATNAVRYLHDLQAAAARPVGLAPGEIDAANVFVTYHGMVKFLAAGVPPTHRGSAPASSGAHKVGASSQTSAYPMPGQVDGVADRRSDVFSLGVLLWTCLTGQRPQLAPGRGQDPTLSQRLMAPSSLRADVPEALDVIAMRALSAERSERFQSAHELSEALDRYLLRRDSRPTHKHLRRWMERLFNAERASLQLQIAQGRDVAAALSLLGNPQRASGSAAPPSHPRASLRPRELWSTSHSLFSRLERGSAVPPRSLEPGAGSAAAERLPVTSTVPRPMLSSSTSAASPARSEAAPATPPGARQLSGWMLAGLLVTCAVIALGTAIILSSSDQGSPLRAVSQDAAPAARSGRIDVRSTPEGAAVFLDGEPTGLRTPVVLKGLTVGRSVRLRVEKAGFAGQERELEIAAGPLRTLAFELLASEGLVHFAGVPADGRVYVDEVLVDVEADKPLHLPAGRHAVRVETPSSLLFSGTMVIVAGEQTFRVGDMEATQ
jgi:eukaryotic-like serine/threonine-protein kinase